MASLATANLPSSDEEDDDYDPSLDPTGEKEPTGQQGQTARRKRGRGAAGGAEDAAEDAQPKQVKPQNPTSPTNDGHDVITPAQAAKKARISAMFDQLHESCTGSANKLSKSNISLASLCSNTDPKKKKNTDLLWMRNLGITPGSSAAKTKQRNSDAAASVANRGLTTPQPPAAAAAAAAAADDDDQQAPATAPPAVQTTATAAATAAAENGSQPSPQQQQQIEPGSNSSSIRSAAAAALAAAREAASGGVSKSYNKITVTETRRFAGKDIEVTVSVDKDSKEAKRAAERQAAAATGLDAFLSQIEGKKKVSVLDKSKMDWQDFKSTDVEVQEELEAHRRSDKQYLDKQDFLKRAELREYEIERDKRLASDVRLRGRL